jgi:hypothetical protein
MNKMTHKILILLGIVQPCIAFPRPTDYAFPKRIQRAQPQPSNEITAFSDEAQDDEIDQEWPIANISQSSEPPAQEEQENHKTHCKHFRMNVAPQYSYMIFRSHGVKTQRGSLGGISAEAEYKKREHVYGDASFLWNQGDIHAHGHRSHKWQEAIAQGMIGYTASISENMSITPYVGFGYRKVMHHRSFENQVTLDYYQYFVPFGFLTDYCICPRFTMSLNLKALPAVDSRVYFTNHPNVFWKLKNKGNYEADLFFKWTAAITKYLDFDISLVPFFKYWVLGPNSKIDMHSRTQTYWGAELQFGFTL